MHLRSSVQQKSIRWIKQSSPCPSLQLPLFITNTKTDPKYPKHTHFAPTKIKIFGAWHVFTTFIPFFMLLPGKVVFNSPTRKIAALQQRLMRPASCL